MFEAYGNGKKQKANLADEKNIEGEKHIEAKNHLRQFCKD